MANNSAAIPLHQPRDRMVDTPEAALIYNPAISPDSLDDVMLCGLTRTQAVVRLLMGDVGDNDGFTHSTATLTNVLWLLDGQLEQLKVVMRSYNRGATA